MPDRSRIDPGSILDRSWIDAGSVLVRSKIDLGSILDRCRIDHGSMPDRSRIDPGSNQDRSWIDPESMSDRFWIDPGSILRRWAEFATCLRRNTDFGVGKVDRTLPPPPPPGKIGHGRRRFGRFVRDEAVCLARSSSIPTRRESADFLGFFGPRIPAPQNHNRRGKRKGRKRRLTIYLFLNVSYILGY